MFSFKNYPIVAHEATVTQRSEEHFELLMSKIDKSNIMFPYLKRRKVQQALPINALKKLRTAIEKRLHALAKQLQMYSSRYSTRRLKLIIVAFVVCFGS